MPKKLTQHEIRQRAVQTLFSYEVQREMSEKVLQEFQENIKNFKAIMERPIRFETNFQDDRITIRGFKKRFTSNLESLAEIYDILGIELEQTALSKALILVRDFGGLTKKMRDNEAIEVFQAAFDNLNLVRLFTLDLDEEPVGPKVLEFIHETKKATPKQALAAFNKIFVKLRESSREKYTLEFFEPLSLSAELNQIFDEAEHQATKSKLKLLNGTKNFVLNYNNESNELSEIPAYFTELVDGVLDNQSILRATISGHLAQNWSFTRLTGVERAILSLGAYEILFTETPDIVAINEAIELSKDFSDEKSSKFVNGVLTNLIKTAE
jgi:N utilization substance protein B